MDSAYIRALEMRAKWLRWAKEELQGQHYNAAKSVSDARPFWKTALPAYIDTLENGETFYMNQKFCELTEHARDTVPDNLVFDSSWMHSHQGWLWIETPFKVPEPAFIKKADTHFKVEGEVPSWVTRISAIGWRPVVQGLTTAKGMTGDVAGRVAGTGAYQFVCFLKNPGRDDTGFGCWSYFMLQEGDRLIDRIKAFEQISNEVGGGYPQERATDMLHEIRWVYSAFYLMAQRLAATVEHRTDRNTRRRNEIAKLKVTPLIRVITLRRMEEARKKEASGEAVDWQWQWSVRGHWRNQFYPSDNTHRPVFVEAYIKGPEWAPLKPAGSKLFVAER